MAACILSKLVAFQTKSTENPWVQSTGTPSFRFSSRQISSDTSEVSLAHIRNSLFGTLTTAPTPSHMRSPPEFAQFLLNACIPFMPPSPVPVAPTNFNFNSSPGASLSSPLSSLGIPNQASRFWFNPISQRTVISLSVCDSFIFLS